MRNLARLNGQQEEADRWIAYIREYKELMMEPKKEYVKPEVTEEIDMETRAGSPAPCPPADPLDIDGKPPC
jgi:hypothetical protein